MVTIEPPAMAHPDRSGRAVAEYPLTDATFDLELFEALNAEYASRPIVPEAPKYDHASLVNRHVSRLQRMHRAIDLTDRDVLVFGCGNGYEVWLLSHAFNAEAWGIDIVERTGWSSLADDRTTSSWPTSPGTVRSMKRCSIGSSRGTSSSTSSIRARHSRPSIGRFDRAGWRSSRRTSTAGPSPRTATARSRSRGRTCSSETTSSGRSTVVAAKAGFEILRERLRAKPIDEPFYRRFENVLGRYPRADLERDFFDVVLRKPRNLR